MRLMYFAHQRGKYVGVCQIKIVAGSVEISRHQADGMESVLCPVRLAQLDSGDFGNGIEFVRRFKRPAKQIVFFERLRRQFRVNAGRTQELQFFDSRAIRAIDDVELNSKIVAEK